MKIVSINTVDENIKWMGYLGDRGIHISSFISGGAYYNDPKEQETLLISNDWINLSIVIKEKTALVAYDREINIDKLISIYKICKESLKNRKVKDIKIINAFNSLNSVDVLNSGLKVEYTNDQKYTIFYSDIETDRIKMNNKWLNDHGIKKLCKLVTVKEIDTKNSNDDFKKVKSMFKDWIDVQEIKKDSAKRFGTFAFKRATKEYGDRHTLVGVFIGEILLGYRAYTPYGKNSLFITLENGLNDVFKTFDSVCENISLVYNKYYSVNTTKEYMYKMMKNKLKRILYYSWNKHLEKNYPNIKTINIDSTGDYDIGLYNYKKTYFNSSTEVLSFKL